jgi:hypothetical protein
MKSKLNPNFEKSITKIIPFNNSTVGYLGEILSPQHLHFPLRNRKLSTGIKSYHFNGVLQLGQ